MSPKWPRLVFIERNTFQNFSQGKKKTCWWEKPSNTPTLILLLLYEVAWWGEPQPAWQTYSLIWCGAARPWSTAMNFYGRRSEVPSDKAGDSATLQRRHLCPAGLRRHNERSLMHDVAVQELHSSPDAQMLIFFFGFFSILWQLH